ncbi:unnamed protein product [Protopolystoma xenopodis]|uniref:Uncharacterized protein n=1 Tax=Protopolystoma xenopodis TaxID=117903 RepID=A0A448WJK4_9PLAT|nr:unnamed protein product [Protopolystoma xenopodis]
MECNAWPSLNVTSALRRKVTRDNMAQWVNCRDTMLCHNKPSVSPAGGADENNSGEVRPEVHSRLNENSFWEVRLCEMQGKREGYSYDCCQISLSVIHHFMQLKMAGAHKQE